MKKTTDSTHRPGGEKTSTPWEVGETTSENSAVAKNKHGGRRAGAGGKPLEFDLVLVRNLSRTQCTDAEIAAVLHVSERSIKRHKKRPEFREAMDAGKAEGRVSMRRQLFKLAEGGNVAATIRSSLGNNSHPRTECQFPAGANWTAIFPSWQ